MEALWNAKFMGITFFNVYYTFFIFAIGGWVYESIFQSILEKKVLNRGFLNGPIIPIYGLGGMAVYILLFNDYTKKFTTEHTFLNGVAIYFAGLIFCTILEYLHPYLWKRFSMPAGGIILPGHVIFREEYALSHLCSGELWRFWLHGFFCRVFKSSLITLKDLLLNM